MAIRFTNNIGFLLLGILLIFAGIVSLLGITTNVIVAMILAILSIVAGAFILLGK